MIFMMEFLVIFLFFLFLFFLLIMTTNYFLSNKIHRKIIIDRGKWAKLF